jgi:hypothetical protein
MNELINNRLRLQVAQFLALADPRCGSDLHNQITKVPECPVCHLGVIDYVRTVPMMWPA